MIVFLISFLVIALVLLSEEFKEVPSAIYIAGNHVVIGYLLDAGAEPSHESDANDGADDVGGFNFHCLVLLAFESAQFVSHVAVLLEVIVVPVVFHAEVEDFFLKVFDAFFSAHLFSLLCSFCI